MAYPQQSLLDAAQFVREIMGRKMHDDKGTIFHPRRETCSSSQAGGRPGLEGPGSPRSCRKEAWRDPGAQRLLGASHGVIGTPQQTGRARHGVGRGPGGARAEAAKCPATFYQAASHQEN